MINSGNLKKKFSKANKFNAQACVVLGEEEWKSKKLIFKDLVSGSQSLIDEEDIKAVSYTHLTLPTKRIV